ncbi:MAG: DUF1501 domain-containing protein [bacterium]|nr:DUF1501 domain-containing protein [bacterium]
MNTSKNQSAGVTRRDAIRFTLSALGVAALGPVDRAAAAVAPVGSPRRSGKFVVVVELDGGNDWLNTVVPQGLSNYAVQRPTLALGSGATLPIDTGPYGTSAFRLHSELGSLAQMYRDGDVAIVQKVGYQRANKSHDTSRKIWAQGLRDTPNGNGWVGRYAAQYAPTTLGAVSIACGRHRAFVGAGSDPLSVGSLSRFRFDNDSRYSNNHAHRLEVLRDILDARTASPARDALLTGHALAGQIRDAVDNYTSTVTYRTGPLSQRLLDVARMVQAGFETRVYYTRLGGFDTHGAQLSRHAGLLQDLDEGLADLANDLKAMGVWSDTVIVVMSEFGRRNFENGSSGTDHGEAGNMILLGGAVRGGLHGPALTNADLDASNLAYGVDFRGIYGRVLEAHLGVADPTTVFAEELAIASQPDVIL